ncbi:alpha/beta fold hydrolase [Nocardioides currus]|uniref:Alpha/beta hydrolase n=1 Tax=Nocardioides currus TaxID=2133958 RepID=A0A2R7Z2E0_9ACTN|nr:alpha/beta hydrolase [Nocardioides currus]PUA82801.1 alpha/beta hydrolase [Nocardioides currus]
MTSPSTGFLARPDGPRIAFDDVGSGAPAILLSHGLFMNRSMFEPQVTHFRDRHRCIAWDERSHGDTEWTGPYSLWDSARDQLALMDHLDIDRAVLVGMSQGGLLSLRTALLAPERVLGLVMLSSQAGTINPESGAAFTTMADTWQGGPSQDTLAAIGGKILGPGVDEDVWFAHWRGMPAQHVRDAVSALTSRDDLTDRLGEIACPTLVVHGSADASTGLDRARAVHDGVPDSRGMVVVPDAPHAANLTDPQAVNSAIDSFLAQL